MPVTDKESRDAWRKRVAAGRKSQPKKKVTKSKGTK
jgi:hypothetical protein